MDLSALLSTIDETAGLGRLREALSRPPGRGKSARATAGVNDAAKPATLAALVADEERPVLILTGRPARAEVLAEELAAGSVQPLAMPSACSSSRSATPCHTSAWRPTATRCAIA
jgi:hypothetical protein